MAGTAGHASSRSVNWVMWIVWAVSLPAAYRLATPEVTDFSGGEQDRDFRIAARRTTDERLPLAEQIEVFRLADLRAGKVDTTDLSFLLPGDVPRAVPGGDTNRVTIVERGSDWQLVRYDYGNGHSSVSRYRAFDRRIEPVSYRMTGNFAIFIAAWFLLIPARGASLLLHALWRLARRSRSRPREGKTH